MTSVNPKGLWLQAFGEDEFIVRKVKAEGSARTTQINRVISRG
jgi:hypothetical protein